MRRLVNFLLILVVVCAVGFLLVKAKIVNLPGRHSSPAPLPTVAPAPPREHLRVSVANRPESLILGALGRLLETDGMKIEIVPFDPESSWMELAAGEIDLVVAPIGDAVTAQARFNCGRFLFVSGLSEGYDTIFAKAAPQGALKNLGIVGARNEELFAIAKFPEARLLTADSSLQLQAWLNEGAVQAAVLESASLKGDLAQKAVKLGGTSPDAPMPTIVVLSRDLALETPENQSRLTVLAAALDSWGQLIGYLTDKPDLLRSTLREEAEAMGIDLERLLKDYRFLSPGEGRQALLEGAKAGLLRQTLDLLVLAKTNNLTKPDWEMTLTIPASLEQQLGASVSLDSPATPTPAITASASASPSSTPTTNEQATTAFLGSFHPAGEVPNSPWPKPKKVSIKNAQPFPAALTSTRVGVVTSDGFAAYTTDGELAFNSDTGGPAVCDVLADPSTFYVTRAGQLQAIDEQGKTLWTFEFEGSARTTPLLTSKDLVMTVSSASEHKLVAVARETGEVSWQASLAGAPAGSPAYAEAPAAAILLVDESGQLGAWQAETGSALWRSALPKPTALTPATLGELVAVADPRGGVALLSLTDGKQLWATELGSPIAVAPTLTEDAVLIPAEDSTVYALNRTDGAIAGKVAIDSSASSPVMVFKDTAVVCDSSGGAHQLELGAKPSLSWSISASKSALLGPSFAAKHFALLDQRGTLLIYPR